MDRTTILAIISQVTKSLTPLRLLLLEDKQDETIVLIVSKAYEGLSFNQRFDNTMSLIDADPTLQKHYFILELLSPSEYEKFKNDIENRAANLTGQNSVAASPAAQV